MFGMEVFKETSADFKITVLPSVGGFGRTNPSATTWFWLPENNPLYRVEVNGT
jgi:hypothetical protein